MVHGLNRKLLIPIGLQPSSHVDHPGGTWPNSVSADRQDRNPHPERYAMMAVVRLWNRDWGLCMAVSSLVSFLCALSLSLSLSFPLLVSQRWSSRNSIWEFPTVTTPCRKSNACYASRTRLAHPAGPKFPTRQALLQAARSMAASARWAARDSPVWLQVPLIRAEICFLCRRTLAEVLVSLR
jgi:hypothetical protein